jgi:2-polyprenyl-3-methyl-5-hydroxy-6-metoxy-1,4-benzoquinol methylase
LILHLEFELKSYYHAHEAAYQGIRDRQEVGWGNAKTLAELGDQETQSYLKSMVSECFDNVEGLRALDLGCGSGTTAFTLANLGFSVVGVDVSETAIDMARELATQQSLEIDFRVFDVLGLESLGEQLDLIYDSHCLHCIVFDEDRRKVLEGVKKLLRSNGVFILDTMVLTSGCNPTDGHDVLRFDEDHILWHKTGASNDRGVVQIEGQHWCAQRRILPSERIVEEVAQLGFSILSARTDVQGDGEPAMLRLVLRPRMKPTKDVV